MSLKNGNDVVSSGVVVTLSVKELKKMLNYAEQNSIKNVVVNVSRSSGIGSAVTVSKLNGEDPFDVTDVDSW